MIRYRAPLGLFVFTVFALALVYQIRTPITLRCRILNSLGVTGKDIATPVRSHYEMAKACLSLGKHVLIEKPMTRTEAEGLCAKIGKVFEVI